MGHAAKILIFLGLLCAISNNAPASTQDNSLDLIHLINQPYLIAATEQTNINQDTSIDLNDFSEFEDDDLEAPTYDIYDPFESLNRQFFRFSLWVDHKLVHPLQYVYFTVVPKPMRKGLINFFNNLKEPVSIVNHLLQFKIVSASQTMLRFAINSTLGGLGLVDVATTLNLPRNSNDLGYTLTYYHVGEGFYIFVPVLGPYSFKNGLSEIATNYIYATVLVNNTGMDDYFLLSVGDAAYNVAYYLDVRKAFLNLVNTSQDSYSLVRSSYIQNRLFRFNQLKHSW